MQRQRILAKEDRPRLWAVIDEAAIRRVVGDPEVMREQLRYLMGRGLLAEADTPLRRCHLIAS